VPYCAIVSEANFLDSALMKEVQKSFNMWWKDMDKCMMYPFFWLKV